MSSAACHGGVTMSYFVKTIKQKGKKLAWSTYFICSISGKNSRERHETDTVP